MHLNLKTVKNILAGNIWFFLILFFASANIFADVKMPSVFSDNMILQRGIPLNIWGWAAAKETITVSFAGQTVSSVADNDGKWLIKLNPIQMSKEPQELKVSGKNNISFKNVLVGDVWICSGQSNMGLTVAVTVNAKKEIEASENPLIRHIKINNSINLYPQDNSSASQWAVANSSSAKSFTAAGYYFAKEIVREAGVPVGLINTSWGGTGIEPWIPAEGFRKSPELKSISEQVDSWIPTTIEGKEVFLKYIKDIKDWIPDAENAIEKGKMPRYVPLPPGGNNDYTKPTMIFNSMVSPLANYGIKGVLWYQGEYNGNRNEGEIYVHKMKALISSWRTLWKQGDFPFYYVQLANYQTSDPNNPAGGDGWANTRDAQLKILSVVPFTGMAVAIDIGESDDIHPKNKQDIGKRLAAWALSETYGRKNIHSGPIFKELKKEGSKIRIFFNETGSGLITAKKDGLSSPKETAGEKMKYFALAGADKKWHWADAVIDGNTVVVSSSKVAEPVAVRYAFMMNPQGVNFYNKEGFPASPFRTDNW